MPRKARLDAPGVVHHVMIRGIERCTIFRDDQDRQEFLRRLEGIIKKSGARLYAWCLMPNHVHLLIRPTDQSLAWIMRRLLTGYAVAFNRRHRRSGHLFQNRYKSIAVEEEAYFLELVRYIHLNPVRAGLLSSVADLDHCTVTGHAVLMGNTALPCQDVQGVLSWFDEKARSARRLYKEFVEAKLRQGTREDLRGGGLIRSAGGVAAILERIRSGAPREAADERILGSGRFVERVLLEQKAPPASGMTDVAEILQAVATARRIDPTLILGRCRIRRVAGARSEFLARAHREAGLSFAALARLCGISDVAVRKAVLRADQDIGALSSES